MLTKNFAESEFDVHERVPDQYRGNIPELARLAQWFRDLAGGPAIVESCYRSPARNAAVGGSATSDHLKARAVDLVFTTASDRTMFERLLAAEKSGRAPLFGQFIVYDDTNHIHVSLPWPAGSSRTPREHLRSRKVNGVRQYFPLTSAAQITGPNATVPAGVRAAGFLVCLLVGAAALTVISGNG